MNQLTDWGKILDDMAARRKAEDDAQAEEISARWAELEENLQKWAPHTLLEYYDQLPHPNLMVMSEELFQAWTKVRLATRETILTRMYS